MKTLSEINKYNNDNLSYVLMDSRLNQTMPLRNFYAVKKMPNEYFNNKFKKPEPIKDTAYIQKNNVWILYGRDSCPFCKNSIRIINNIIKKDDEFIYIDVEHVSKYDKQSVLDNLKNIIGDHNTVPIIFCNNKFIGGNSELNKFIKKT